MRKLRRLVQITAALVANGRLFITKANPIYQGPLKHLCFPGLNCYSCPASAWACPLGALQNAFTTLKLNIQSGNLNLGLYVIGSMGMIAAIFGRAPCAWLCPFGLLQDLLFKIRVKKRRFWRPLAWGRYACLILLVVLLPIFLTDQSGYGQTSFCKYLCPAGTLEAGIPLMILKPSLRGLAHLLFYYKLAIMVLLLYWSIITLRPFCRSLCPLGLLFGFFNRISWLRLRFNRQACVQCGACEKVCPTGVMFATGKDDINSSKCIRCMKCTGLCPAGAVTIEFSSLLREGERKGEGCNCYQKQG